MYAATNCRRSKVVLAVQQWHNNSLAAAFHGWLNHIQTRLSHMDKVSNATVVTLTTSHITHMWHDTHTQHTFAP